MRGTHKEMEDYVQRISTHDAFPLHSHPSFHQLAEIEVHFIKKRCIYHALLLEPYVTPNTAKEFEILKFNHP